MAQCGKCKFFGLLEDCSEELRDICRCDCFEYDTKRGFDDELDEYLFENHQVKSGCCSSIENLKYDIAREVAERMIQQFDINIQYVSQEERRKKMDEMYGVNLLKEV